MLVLKFVGANRAIGGGVDFSDRVRLGGRAKPRERRGGGGE